MRILLIGGSGYLGTILMPFFRRENTVRVMDIVEPKVACDDFIQGSVTNQADLKRAMTNMEGLLYFVMVQHSAGDLVADSYDVNVKGVHLALQAAKDAGLTHAVYASTLSIYNSYTTYYLTSEKACPGDATHIYGLTKWLGEQVCEVFGKTSGMTVTSLRLCFPMPLEKWEATVQQSGYTLCTAAPDLADAMLRSLRRKGPGYEVLFTTGDCEERQMSQKRAREVLGWEPKARPRQPVAAVPAATRG